MTHTRDTYDSPWKEAIELWFEPFMAFFFPHIHAQIDWSKGYTFLNTELLKITGDAQTGNRFADKLVRVYLLGGTEALIFIHIEIQGKKEVEFEKRMFIYHYRIFDFSNAEVVSLAVLTDMDKKWRPVCYTRGRWGCAVNFTFPTVKLLDYQEEWETLERSTNPFATVVMAHLKTQETKQKGEERKRWKLDFLKRLYESKYKREDILELLRFLDWIMWLPEELEQQFVNEWNAYEEAIAMRYVTSFERFAREEGIALGWKEGVAEGIKKGWEEGIAEGIKKGRQEGVEQGVEKGLLRGLEKGRQEGVEQGIQEGVRKGLMDGLSLALELKFGDEASSLFAAISPITALPHLRAIHQAIRTANTPDELRAVIQAPPDGASGENATLGGECNH